MAKKYVNGVRLPEEVDRESRALRDVRGRNIAAIDFGTTACSLAYSLKNEKTVEFIKLDNEEPRVPTAILVDSDGEVVDFGKQARKKYAKMSKEKKSQCYYFHRIKMDLQHDQNVAWNNVVKALNGKEFFIVEVIAMILKYVKDRLLSIDVAHGITGPLNASDFDWVITVPAIWKARGKQMMREAAYKAGIASQDDEITSLTIAEKSGGYFTTISPKVDASLTTPEALSLALEPEAAALYCLEQAKQQGSRCADSKCYMVLDIGGGTVDISVHKVLPSGAVQVVLPPAGNDFGGTRVNEEFKVFLGNLVNDPNFSRYLFTGNPETASKHSAELDHIVNQLFEEQKCFFGDKGPSDDEAMISLPYTFMVSMYAQDLEKGVDALNDPQIHLDDNDLLISYNKMEEFFSPAVKAISECVLQCYKDVSHTCTIDTVFFVGGFGGCKYLYEKVGAAIKQKHACETFRPSHHTLAVASGAVVCRQKPGIVHSRVADATYGTACATGFDPNLHDVQYRFYDDDRNAQCNNLFIPFVIKDDTVKADKVLSTNYVPLVHNQKSMTFSIYTTKSKVLKYVETPEHKISPGMLKIGKLSINMPVAYGDKSREVKLTFDFSHTEILVKAYDITSGERATTTVDFLTDM